jgi:hypothetical protein
VGRVGNSLCGRASYVYNSLKIATINLDNYCYEKDIEAFGLTLIVLEYVFYLFVDCLTVTMKYFW